MAAPPEDKDRPKRIPEKVEDALGDRTEILLISKGLGNAFPCKPEMVRNGVILHNTRSTRVFKNTEFWNIIKGEHSRWETDIDIAEEESQ